MILPGSRGGIVVELKRVGDLEVNEDMAFQRRDWAVQRVRWVVSRQHHYAVTCRRVRRRAGRFLGRGCPVRGRTFAIP